MDRGGRGGQAQAGTAGHGWSQPGHGVDLLVKRGAAWAVTAGHSQDVTGT